MNASAPLVDVLDDGVFESEEKILQALVKIRNSPLPSEEKARLRDLFLDFVGSTDETARAAIKDKILGRSRPAPAKTSATEKNPGPEETPTHKRTRPVPVFSTPRLKNEGVVTPPTPRPASTAPVATPNPPELEAIVPTRPVKNQASKATPSATLRESALEVKRRIDEIKHDVNRRAGSPSNLIDADQNVGRAYMAALLDAMKNTPSGGPAAAESLKKLESVYQQVLAVLEKKGSVQAPRPRPQNQTPPPAERRPDLNPNVTRNAPTLDMTPAKRVAEKVAAPSVPTAPPERRQVPRPISPAVATPRTTSPIAETPIKKPDTIETPRAVEMKAPVMEKGTSSPKMAASPSKLRPVSTVTTFPEKISELKERAGRLAEEAKRPITELNDEKVTAGLRQLLSEWKLFKGSGWLGRGPSGMDHPLYQRLAKLSMAAVIAGRFEGATPEIKQTLTDYMNGWRYEQGIVHEMSEPFERYLRRVVFHILKRQNDPLQAKEK